MSCLKNSDTLLAAAKNGDENAWVKIVNRMMPSLEAISAEYAGKSALTTDDLLQEGKIGIIGAVYSYSPQGGAGFETYCSKCIRNSILSALRSQLTQKNEPLNFYVNIDDAGLSSGSMDDPQNFSEMQERMRTITDKIEHSLTELEREVMLLHINGHGYDYIASALCVSEKSVDNAMQRARKKLKY